MTDPMQTILAATDLSARSDRALDRAVRLARRHGARVVALHVAEDAADDAALARRIAEAEKAVGSFLAARARGVRAEARAVAGDACAEIVREAEAAGAELIVLGAHVDESLGDRIVGSTAWRVLRSADRPVLLASGPVLADYARVLVGVDFSECSKAALRLARRLGAPRIEVVHAYHVPFAGLRTGDTPREETVAAHRRDLDRLVAEAIPGGEGAPEVRTHLRQGTAADVIRRACDELRPDVLAVGTHGRTGFAHAVLGSVAENLLRRPPCDVLAVRTA